MLAHLPQGRRIAASAAFCLCVAVLIVTAFRGLSDAFLVRGAQAVAIAVAAIGLILMICGVLGLLITLFLLRGGGHRGERTVVRDREPY